MRAPWWLTTASSVVIALRGPVRRNADAIQGLRVTPTLIGRSAQDSDPESAERFWELAVAEMVDR